MRVWSPKPWDHQGIPKAALFLLLTYLFIHSANILLKAFHVPGTTLYLGNTVDGLSLECSSLAPECFWNKTHKAPQAGSDTGLLIFLDRGRRGLSIIRGPECVLK